jgi:hypothetical protein
MRRIAVLVQIILILSATQAIAENLSPEIGLIGFKDWTKSTYLQSPYGVGFYLFQPVSSKVKLTFEYDYLTSRTDNIKYSPDYFYDKLHGSAYEGFNNSHLHSFEVGFRHLLSRSGATSLEFGGGLCLVHLEGGQLLYWSTYQWYSADANKFGLLLDIGLVVDESEDFPFVMRFGFRHRFIDKSQSGCLDCSSAYRKAITSTELRFSLGYQFGHSKSTNINNGFEE